MSNSTGTPSAGSELRAAIEAIAARFRSGNRIPIDKAMVPAEEWHALVAALPAAESLASLPKDATEVRRFMRSHCEVEQYAIDEETPSDGDRYQLTAHDFLTAVRWWVDCPALATIEAPEPLKPTRQYYWKNDRCEAFNAHKASCICWHDEGTGPYPDGKHPQGDLTWRTKPAVASPHA